MEKGIETFLGRLGRDPDLRYTPTQKPVCYLSIAVDREKEGNPEWRRIVVWGKQAELCKVHLKKGEEIFVQGKSEKKSFETKEGGMKTYTEVNARVVGFVQ